MLFKRKAVNRRLHRDFVLDVKLRSDQVRASRMRVATRAAAICLGTCAVLFALWWSGAWALDKFIFENEAFAIQSIEVRTDGKLSIEQIRQAARVKSGSNLLALDLLRVKRDLELAPTIRSAAVERVLPHTLRIRVIEREPIAQVPALRRRPSGAGFDLIAFYLDIDGYVILPIDRPTQRSLPMLSGLNVSELRTGRQMESPQVLAALKLIDEFERSPMVGIAELKQIDVSSPNVLNVATGQGSVITFGLSDLAAQLRRWRSVHEAGQKIGKSIASLDLSVQKNIPARWMEAAAPSSKNSKAKKKNV